jgi:hypothetical protein
VGHNQLVATFSNSSLFSPSPGLKYDLDRSREETEERSLQLQETLVKLETVRCTLQDAKEVNNYKVKELKEKVSTTDACLIFVTFLV